MCRDGSTRTCGQLEWACEGDLCGACGQTNVWSVQPFVPFSVHTGSVFALRARGVPHSSIHSAAAATWRRFPRIGGSCCAVVGRWPRQVSRFCICWCELSYRTRSPRTRIHLTLLRPSSLFPCSVPEMFIFRWCGCTGDGVTRCNLDRLADCVGARGSYYRTGHLIHMAILSLFY